MNTNSVRGRAAHKEHRNVAALAGLSHSHRNLSSTSLHSPRCASPRRATPSSSRASSPPPFPRVASGLDLVVSCSPLAAKSASVQAPSAATDSLKEFVLEGPLLASCGITAFEVVDKWEEWLTVGRQLAKQLDFDHDNMDGVQRLRVYQYYLPVYFWARQQLAQHKTTGSKHALVLGISAPQGCGKTTIVEQLELLFNWAGSKAAAVSIDDFYLTYKDQTALAEANPANALLQYRGNAGTHDLALGTRALEELRSLREPGKSALVPRYNKSAYGGRGDRADESSWPRVEGPLEVLFFEGWMLGFAPVADDQVAEVDPSLLTVNQQLRAYRQAWDALVDSWLVVRIGDPQWVYRWRLQAEERMRASGKAGMSESQIADFVSRFMPAYKAYLPGLYKSGPTTARAGKTLIIEVDQNRSPVPQQPQPVV